MEQTEPDQPVRESQSPRNPLAQASVLRGYHAAASRAYQSAPSVQLPGSVAGARGANVSRMHWIFNHRLRGSGSGGLGSHIAVVGAANHALFVGPVLSPVRANVHATFQISTQAPTAAELVAQAESAVERVHADGLNPLLDRRVVELFTSGDSGEQPERQSLVEWTRELNNTGSVHDLLEKANLHSFTEDITEQGFFELSDLVDASSEELQGMCSQVHMKVGHTKKFFKAVAALGVGGPPIVGTISTPPPAKEPEREAPVAKESGGGAAQPRVDLSK